MRRDELDYVPRIITFRRKYPHDPDLILPTRFGNVIHASETYSLNVYGVDAIPAWHRLAAVVLKDFAGQVDDARAEVNFWNNVWVVAILFTVLAAARFIWDAYSLVIGAGARPLSFHAFVQIHWEYAVFAVIWQRAHETAAESDATEPNEKREKAKENNGEAKDGIEEVEDANADTDADADANED
jgi:hypothetical protein